MVGAVGGVGGLLEIIDGVVGLSRSGVGVGRRQAEGHPRIVNRGFFPKKQFGVSKG